MAQPVCAAVSEVFARAITGLALNTHVQLQCGGTCVCIEVPQFSSMGASVIGMNSMPEAKLEREAQTVLATVAMVTDYDCWHPKEAHGTADAAIANFMKNAGHARGIAAEAIRSIARDYRYLWRKRLSALLS